ncbi:transmembrane protein 56-like [Pyrus ussuriensis x Pyrus communis]|uniref:Transmembrane protein 56-like n=1 Tax=Pyrus ussuriensis x Pyrus communis TaxID=2448454 RepID=A0A5N5GMI0_9ROSA|nr:transmembrane protein 56-like [Pyrus ussuriensis x Pyrus communis]
MVGFSFPFGLVSISGHLVPEKEFHLLASVLFGIFLCNIIYRLARLISLLSVEGYDELSKAEKVEWNNRGFSTVHAIAVAFASFYLVVLSDTFHEDHRDEPIVSRRSTFSDTTLGISFGYFLSDLGMIFWYFPALGGLEYVLHHALSMYSIFLALLSGQGQIYILMVLFSESTTPFVNMRWYLDVAGRKNSNLYVFNGAALFLGWLVARILLFIYFFVHMFIHFDQVKTMFPLVFYSLLPVPPMLATMNLIWFWKITKGLIKTVSKAKHSQ